MIETSEASDLKYMKSLVQALESASSTHAHRTSKRQARLFKALYDVAEKYVEINSRPGGRPSGVARSAGRDCGAVDTLGGPRGHGLGSVGYGAISNDGETAGQVFPNDDTEGMEFMDGLGTWQGTAFGDVDVEMDFSGAQLLDWFNENQSIMSTFEDT